jgi:hypothetical protein
MVKKVGWKEENGLKKLMDMLNCTIDIQHFFSDPPSHFFESLISLQTFLKNKMVTKSFFYTI